LAVAVPLTIQNYVRYSYQGETATLTVQEPGNLLVLCPGEVRPLGVVGRSDHLCEGREGIKITAGPNDRGVLTLRPRVAVTDTLATIQLYSNTILQLQRARAPRFGISPEPHRFVLDMESGRARVTMLPQPRRTVLLQVYTPQALLQMTEGNVSIEVNGQEAQFAVNSGQAIVVARANHSATQLDAEQRAVVPTGGGLTGVVPAERNLIADSGFREPLGQVWKTYNKDPQIETEPLGTISPMLVEGILALDMARTGIGHLETGLTQEINKDIRDFESLQLRLVLRLLQQNVPVCGQYGTECPIMVRIDYIDEGGGARSWQQGFYSLPDNNPDPNLRNQDFCVICPFRNPHIRVTNGVWYPFESPNLVPLLRQGGPAPAVLKSISIYASGHTYQSQVSEIELSGQE
jgi:hypothetical protein